jgi:hypothetical protein
MEKDHPAGRAACCAAALANVVRYDDHYVLAHDQHRTLLAYCPFCGARFGSAPFRPLAGDALTFDVDGVLCDNSDESVPYRDRKPYPHAVAYLRALSDAGVAIHLMTARYMRKFKGDAAAAREHGLGELRGWLERHRVSFDTITMGKPSSLRYYDDKGVRLDSNEGITPWEAEFGPLEDSW